MLEMKTIKFVVFAFLFCGLIPIASATVPVNNADAAIKSYISAEEEQNYARIYQLLSAAKKKQLKRENSVRDAAGYASLRRISEARWFNFVEKGRRESKGRAVVTFTVVIEENGEQEQVIVNIELLFQSGKWRIEAIDY